MENKKYLSKETQDKIEEALQGEPMSLKGAFYHKESKRFLFMLNFEITKFKSTPFIEGIEEQDVEALLAILSKYVPVTFGKQNDN